MNGSVSHDLSASEIARVSGGYVTYTNRGLRLDSLSANLEMTGGSFRPASIADAVRYGEANGMEVYIDGVKVSRDT